VLNGCEDHPMFQTALAKGNAGTGIGVSFDGVNVTGELGLERRSQMYQMMVSKLTDEQCVL
jgi:hypothetical protein